MSAGVGAVDGFGASNLLFGCSRASSARTEGLDGMVSAALDGLGDMWLAMLDSLDRVGRTHDGLASPCPLFRDIS